ncbi:carbohydrate ABC transporter substrate-binding protein [Phytoactinopolyspora alkaliphila]|uniref:Carbohydrate ABC transporter substrate-binding protein n=1 Tax=Phytoactinopolyspora alkaliphila TaxID=1783498 RepID=A0A6N9YTY0_9ACTN|nr:ABC transporter substrate-binding protein [Phytoactinopolyspora alkaliphila]NED98442.1 carbohydrate ABC transporter substrate-binding protein [Phytoactinopolyspora alkaliphila]
MTLNRKRTGAAVVGCLAGLSLVLTACGDDGDDGGAATGGDDEGNGDCADYEKYTETYGDLDGTTVTVYSSIVTPEDQPHIDSWVPFEECTGIDVVGEFSKEFEAQLIVRVQSGSAPDIAYMPQPGLLQTVVRDTDAVVPAPAGVEANVDEFFGEDWRGYGSVDGTLYAAPLGANVKSFVWYSPSAFSEAGYEVPETWDDMIALSDQIVADGGKPWCAGIGSGDATGWPATDWMEDVMLREHGPDVYDQWYTHEIPFNSPEVADVLERVGSILKNEDYVNGGLGGVQSIASTTFQDGGLPIIDGNCFMHRQASFYQANWPEGTTVAEDGDVFAFYFPTITEEFGRPLLGGAEFVAAFDDRPEVQAVQEFLSSPEWANEKAKVSGPGWLSANTGLDISLLESPIDQLSAELFQDPEAVFRFDASDLMPGEVGAGTFWTEMTNWIANDKDNQAVLDAIESSWP